MGTGYPEIAFDPTQQSNLNVIKPDGVTPGDVFRLNGKSYQFVKFNNGQGNVASSAGRPMYWMDLANNVVTMDKTDNQFGAALAAGCAGICLLSGITDGNYTWIQTGGIHPSTRLNGAGAAGNVVTAPGSDTDAALTTTAIASASTDTLRRAPQVGIQMAAADVNNDAQVYLTILA